MWLGALLLPLVFVSCEKAVLEGGENNGKENKVTRMVTIHPMELHVETMEEPIVQGAKPFGFSAPESPRAAKKLYAVNVYEKKKGVESYSKYAYGLFTDPSKIAIRMTEGNLYRIQCLIAEEGEDTIYNKNGEYLAPFLHGTGKATMAENAFTMSTSENLGFIQKGETNVTATDKTMYPKLVKLYGTVEDFNPSTTDELTIDMKRAVFGLHFRITPPEEGTLNIKYLYQTLSVKASDPAYDHASTYSFNMVDAACMNDYQGHVTLELEWVKDDGTVEKDSKLINLKRNIMTVIDVSVEGPKPRGIGLNEETGEMTTENVAWHFAL